jgi:hypothetical protein
LNVWRAPYLATHSDIDEHESVAAIVPVVEPFRDRPEMNAVPVSVRGAVGFGE